jgi:mono/diheme cytochrome c family protein
MKTHLKINIILVMALLVTSCYRGKPSEDPPIHLNPNMDSQPKYEAQEESEFFEDKLTMRQPVAGTVARGDLREDDAYYRGKNADGSLIDRMPVDITMELLQRGKERYNIYCSPCHDQTGSGKGIIIKKGFLPPPSFHLDRLRQSPDGHFYDVISNGIRNMPSYKHQIPVADRWAIVAYVRALQRSQNAKAGDVPEEIREELK